MLRLLSILVLTVPAQGDWPDYRGPDRRGAYAGPAISAERIESSPAPVWSVEIGDGHSSIAVADGRLFAFALREGLQTLAALDAATGDELWTDAWSADFGGWRSLVSGFVGSGKGPRATPVVDSGRVYALGPAGELRSFDAAAGKLLWRTNILADGDAKNDTHGVAATPLILGEVLIATTGGKAQSLVLGYDKTTGELLWQGPAGKGSYVSPSPARLGGVAQAIIQSADEVFALAPADGRRLWSVEWGSAGAAAQPVVIGESRVLVSDGAGAALIEAQAAGSGFEARLVWTSRTLKNKLSSSVYFDGYVYGLDGSILACIAVETGARRWKEGRFGRGQVLLAGDRLLALAESGEIALIEADPSGYSELARFGGLGAETFAAPALSEGRLYVRGGSRLAAFDLSSASD